MSSSLLLVFTVLLTFTSILAAQQTDGQASKAADTFLSAVKIIELPEGKKMLVQEAWNWEGQPAHYPVYSEAKTLFEGMFSTDVPEIVGYKRLVELKVLTESGGITVKHYMLISYKDKSLGTWKVLTFREAAEVRPIRSPYHLFRPDQLWLLSFPLPRWARKTRKAEGCHPRKNISAGERRS